MKIDLIKHLLRAMEQTEIISPMMSVESEKIDTEQKVSVPPTNSAVCDCIRNCISHHDPLSVEYWDCIRSCFRRYNTPYIEWFRYIRDCAINDEIP